jgi:hypothetical protein
MPCVDRTLKDGWKEFRCQGCGQEFVRRAPETPVYCFGCESERSDAKKARDMAAFDAGI